MLLKECIDEFLVYCSGIKSFSPNTVKGYGSDLEKFLLLLKVQDFCPLSELSVEAVSYLHIRSCISLLSKEKKAPSSINRFISSIRSLFRYAHRLHYCEKNPALECKTVKMPKKVPRYMTQTEVTELCAQPETNELLWAERDRAVFEILYSSGCRVSELASLNMSDLSSDKSSAVVTGKGKKDRRIFFSKEAVKALLDYLNQRNEKIKADCKVAALFINQAGTRLSARGIRWIIARYSSAEGTSRHVSPHGFRHTFATSLLSNGADIRIVQELLGHASISTTQRYTHITTAQLIETYNKSHPHGGKQ